MATLTVNGKPSPTAAVKLFDFEDGTQGWAAGNWQTDPGTVETSTTFASGGAQSLVIDSKNAWFGGAPGRTVRDFTGKSTLSFEMANAPRSIPVSLQVGDDYDWCQIQGERPARPTRSRST